MRDFGMSRWQLPMCSGEPMTHIMLQEDVRCVCVCVCACGVAIVCFISNAARRRLMCCC